MKKILSAFLALAMMVTMVSVCGGHASAAKALPEGVLYYWGFENDSDLTAVEQMDRRADAAGAALYDIIPTNRKPEIAVNQGVSGNALYLDGTYGVRLNDLEKLDLDAYTISFWMLANESRYYPPIVQLGSNMAAEPQQGATTWMEFFQAPENEAGVIYPSVEMYDSEKGAVEFPGLMATMTGAPDNGCTTREWTLITLVVDGKPFTAEDGEEHVGTKLYVNGKLAMDASAETKSINAALPGLLAGENLEGFVGINYQNECFCGYVDELYIFDRALSEEAIQKVYAAGNPSNIPTEEVKVAPPEVTKDPTSEAVNEGGNAYFVARANNYNYINWYIVSPDHSSRIPVSSAPWSFPGLSVSGEGTTTLLLANCPLSLNGWCVEATFTGDGGSTNSGHCFINVNKAPRAQLMASPSSGYFEYCDQPITLTAAPGDTIYYELRTEYQTYSGNVRSGEKIYIPALADIRYEAYLYAYVVGDSGNAISCQYTMDCLPYPAPTPDPEPIPDPTPIFYGGFFSNGEADVNLISTGNNSFAANVSVQRLCNMDGFGSYSNGVVYLSLTDPSCNNMQAEFNVNNGTLFISSSTWEYLPTGTSFSGLN